MVVLFIVLMSKMSEQTRESEPTWIHIPYTPFPLVLTWWLTRPILATRKLTSASASQIHLYCQATTRWNRSTSSRTRGQEDHLRSASQEQECSWKCAAFPSLWTFPVVGDGKPVLPHTHQPCPWCSGHAGMKLQPPFIHLTVSFHLSAHL